MRERQKTTILDVVGSEIARTVVSAFEIANIAMTPTTPLYYELVDGEHQFGAEGHIVEVSAGDGSYPAKKRRKSKSVGE